MQIASSPQSLLRETCTVALSAQVAGESLARLHSFMLARGRQKLYRQNLSAALASP